MTEELHLEKENVSSISEEKNENIEVESKSTADMTEAETEQLMDAVRKQVEYYFSKENLQSDAYLTSHMDANMTVAIATVMKFAKMKALTQDEALLRKALERSTINVIDDRIKPNIKAVGRSTIILREIPSDTAEAEVRAIFEFEGCKQISSMRSDIGDTWFVVMDSEDDAKDTLLDLRLKKRTFRGQSVKGRLKSETVVRSFYPVQAAPSMPPAIYPGMQMQYAGGFVPGPMPIDMRYGYGMGPMGGMIGNMGGMMPPPLMEMPSNIPAPPSSSQDEDKGSPSQNKRRESYPPSAVPPQGSSSAASYKGAATQGAAGAMAPRDGVPRDRNVKNGSAAGARQPTGKEASRPPVKGAKATVPTQRANIEINSANFPPLNSHPTEDGPIPTPGYQGPFTKYSFDDIINIVKDIKDTSLPASIKPTEHPFAMTATANMDLLKRQRTFSIDETREQLKQGRPVQREAVLAGGAGDYISMILGDKEAPLGVQAEAPAAIKEKVEAVKVVSPESTTAAAVAVPAAVGAAAVVAAGVVDAKKPPATGSWAALVAANASAANAATIAATAAAGVARITRPAATKDSAPPSPDRKTNGRVASANGTSSAKKPSAGSTSGSVSGDKGAAAGDKNRDRRRGKEGERKEGERPIRSPVGERRDRGGRERDPAGKPRRSENGSATSADEYNPSEASTPPSVSEDGQTQIKESSGGEKASVLGWGTKPTFANILKQQQAAEALVSTGPGSKKSEKQTMVPLTSSTSTSEGVSDKEKDREAKGEKAPRDRSAPQQPTGVANKKAAISAGVWAKETLPPLKSAPAPSDA